MKWITFLLAVILLAPARPEAPFDQDKVIAAVKVLMYQAPCCGYCARLDAQQARSILAYLQGKPDSQGQELWANLGDKILAELDKIDPAEARKVRDQAQRLKGSAKRTPAGP